MSAWGLKLRWTGGWLLLSLCIAAICQADGSAIKPPDPAQWLVDYALIYGESVEDPQPDDGEYVLAWMEAAARISPELSQAHLWRYDLLDRVGKPDESLKALADYCRSASDDLSAAFKLFDLEFAAAKTAEDRLLLCRKKLNTSDIAPEFASDLHRRIAEIHYAQGNTQLARSDVHQALDIVPLNLPAQQLLVIIDDNVDDPIAQTQLLLTELAVRPSSIDARWRLADLLAVLGMTDEAMAWYAHTEAALARQFPNDPLPADLLLAVATTREESGDYDGALAACTHLLVNNPDNLLALHRVAAIARLAERKETAKKYSDELAAKLNNVAESALESKQAAICYAVAMFHLDTEYDAERALTFARAAYESQPDNVAVITALGRALLENGKLEETVSTLMPIAALNADAALALASALRSLNQPEVAASVLQQAARLRYSGNTHQKISAVLRELHADVPQPPNVSAIRNTLAGFDVAVLDFEARPADFVSFDVRLHRSELPVSAPVLADITLENIGSNAITIGDNRMLSQSVAVSMQVGDDKDTQRLGYLTVELNQRYVLFPGEKMTKTVRIDTATIRSELRFQPQRRRAFKFTFTLAPVISTEGTLVAQFAGIPAISRNLKRIPVEATPPALERLDAQLRTGTEPERLAAVDLIEALVVERREAIRNKFHDYAASTVSSARLTSMLFAAFNDPSPIVRAKAAFAFTYMPLEEDAINEIAPLLADQHFLPRMVACDLLARRQRKKFLPVLERFANDADPLVAKLAGLHAARLK